MRINEAHYNPTILVCPATHRVEWAACVPPAESDPINERDLLTVQGEAAHWLWIALTGHTMAQDWTSEFCPAFARFARAHIESRLRFPQWRHLADFDEEEYWLRARQVVDAWGQHIWPGLDQGANLYSLRLNCFIINGEPIPTPKELNE